MIGMVLATSIGAVFGAFALSVLRSDLSRGSYYGRRSRSRRNRR